MTDYPHSTSPSTSARRRIAEETMASQQQQLLAAHGGNGAAQQRHSTASPAVARNHSHGDDVGLAARSAVSPAQGLQPNTGNGKRLQSSRRGSRTSSSSNSAERRKDGGADDAGYVQHRSPEYHDGDAAAETTSHRQQVSRYVDRRRRRGDSHAASKHQHQPQSRPSSQSTSRPSLGGSRGRKNLQNHLLGFTYSRDSDMDDSLSTFGRGFSSRAGTGGHARKTARHSKEQFLQANCQFIVSEGNYSSFTSALDPDRMVDWVAIQQVKMLCHELPSCPICLSPPRAAKMTRCGHIYCWHCILQYLDYPTEAGHLHSKCPICPEYLAKKDLKSVTMLYTPMAKVDSTVTFRLVKRCKSSVLVTPHLAGTPPSSSSAAATPDDDEHCFTKLLAVPDDCILARVIAKELRELDALLESIDKDAACDLQRPYVRQAMDLCKERQEQLELFSSSATTPSSSLRSSPKQQHQQQSATHESTGPPTVTPPAQQSAPMQDTTTARLARDRMWNGDDNDDDADFPALPASATVTAVTNDDDDTPAEQSASSTGLDEHSTATITTTTPTEVADDTAEDDDPGHNPHDGGKTTTPMSRSLDDVLATSLSAGAVLTGKGVTVAEEPSVFFFQAHDGQHMYMDPFCLRALKEEHGESLECAPLTLSARVLEVSHHTMTEELRKRYRYLCHLPLSCQFTLCEVDIKPLVSDQTFAKFADRVRKNHDGRRRKRREEEKQRKRADAAATGTKKTGYTNPLYVSSSTAVPSAARTIPSSLDAARSRQSSESSVGGGSFNDSAGTGASDSSAGSSLSSSYQDEPAAFSIGSAAANPLSYSRATNSAVATSSSSAGGGSGSSAPTWPRLKGLPESTPASSAAPSSASRAMMSSRGGGSRHATAAAGIASDVGGGGGDEESSFVPSYKDAFNDALTDSLNRLSGMSSLASSEASTAAAAGDVPATATGAGKKGGKGRRKKQVLLFSTNSRHAQ